MRHTNARIDDLDFSNKEISIAASIAKGIGIVLGFILGSTVGGLIGGFAFGGSLSILAGVGIGLVAGSLLGYVIAVVSTDVTRNTKQREDRKPPQESHDAKRAEQHDYSSMTPLLSKQKLHVDAHESAPAPLVSQGLNFRRVVESSDTGLVDSSSTPSLVAPLH